MKRQSLAAALVVLCIGLISVEAFAQPTQIVEDKNVGVRFVIPNEWTWERRQSDIFVNCAPKIESRPGMLGCYFTVRKIKAAAGQTSITDADREKWKSWASANGMRRIVSTRDLKVAGFPALEVVVKHGTDPGAAVSRRVFVLMPAAGVVDASFYAHWNDQDQSARFDRAFRTALDSLKALK